MLCQWLSGPLVLVFSIAAAAEGTTPVKPLERAHAHNDYEHARPLLDALDHGFCSVEADIWLMPEVLLVGHDRQDLRAGRTLEKLYLDPLRERVQTHGGRVYCDGPPFYLLIDVKTDAVKTYAALDKVLARYDDILSVTQGGRTHQKAVTVILSGNRASDLITQQEVRYVGIDGRTEQLDSNPPPNLFPWISANWTLLFSWNGEGDFPVSEKQRLGDLISRAHNQKRKIRFWATPEKEAAWKELRAAGVDYLNTDKLDELQAFLLTAER